MTAAGEVVMPVDLSGAIASALILPTFQLYTGTTHADGTFSIPGVPVGKVLLKLDNRYIEMSGDNVDLVVDAIGRPTISVATAPTLLKFDATNLSAWQATDELQMFCPASSTIAWQMQADASAGTPAVNDTSLTAFTYDLSGADRPILISGSQGDRLTLAQLATTSDGTRSYRTVARSFTPASFDVVNGGTNNLSGAFSTVTPAATLASSWDRPAFDAEIVAHGTPGASQNWSTLAVSPLPEAATRGFYASEPDVLIFAPGYATDHTAVTMSWPIGDPYPTEWTRIVWTRYFRYHNIQLGGATPLAIFDRLYTYRDLSTISPQAPIEPIVGMVVDPSINGMNARGMLTGIGTTPTISWTPPTIGTASRYYVYIDQVYSQSGTTRTTRVALLETSSTEIVVPPGVLMPGLTYMFEITARAAGTLDLEATPNRRTLPEGWSIATSGLVVP